MEIIIRAARVEDANSIANCNIRIAEETEDLRLDKETVLSGVEAALTDPSKAQYYVAEVGNSFAGQLMITLEWSDWRNGYIWWVQSVYVLVEFRQMGVFRKLYQHVRELARSSNAVGLRLYVENDNATARATYKRMGMSMKAYSVMEEMFGAY